MRVHVEVARSELVGVWQETGRSVEQLLDRPVRERRLGIGKQSLVLRGEIRSCRVVARSDEHVTNGRPPIQVLCTRERE
jgi:hypothetical protein